MKLEVLVGMIASGKSTYARKRADEGALVVCHDDLTQMLHARYRYEPGKRELYRAMEEQLACTALMERHDVVIDRTHLTSESRQRWTTFRKRRDEQFFLAMRATPQVIAVTFPIEAASWHAHRRYHSDPRGRSFDEWMRVAMHHKEQAQAEPLDWRAEGFDACVEAPPLATADGVPSCGVPS